MARSKRFELLTPKFVVWCSIQLSYERVTRRAATGPERTQTRPTMQASHGQH